MDYSRVDIALVVVIIDIFYNGSTLQKGDVHAYEG
jgi:hypothetical protein